MVNSSGEAFRMNMDLLERLDALCQPYGCDRKEITAQDITTIREAKSELGYLYDKIEQALKRLDKSDFMLKDSLKYILWRFDRC